MLIPNEVRSTHNNRTFNVRQSHFLLPCENRMIPRMGPEMIVEALKRLHVPHDRIAEAIGRDRTAATKMLNGIRSMKAHEIEPLRALVAEFERPSHRTQHGRSLVTAKELASVTSAPAMPYVPSEATLRAILGALLSESGTYRIDESEIRPLSRALEHALRLLAKNPAIEANPDALDVVVQSAVSLFPPHNTEA